MSAPELLDERLGLRAVEVDPLRDVRQPQDLLHAVARAFVDELHHELVVGDPEVAEAAEPGAAVHEEVQQDPARGVEDLLQVVLGGVGLVDGLHQLLGHVGEALPPAVVVVDDPGRRRGLRVDDVVGGDTEVAERLAEMVVEDEMGLRLVRQVGGDVAGTDRHHPVLDVLGVHEGDVVHQVQRLQQHGAHQSVEVASGDEAVPLGRHAFFSAGTQGPLTVP